MMPNIMKKNIKKPAVGDILFTKMPLNLALDAGVKKLGLFHHNQERLDTGIDAIVKDCHAEIKRSGKKMECFAVGQSMEFKL